MKMENHKKQETLEEVVVKRINDNVLLELHHSTCYSFAELGAKWQQERSYSEEEVHEIILSYQSNVENNPNHINYNEWFEQFKKK